MTNQNKMYILYVVVYFLIIYISINIISWVIGIFIGQGYINNIISFILGIYTSFKLIPYWNNNFQKLKEKIINWKL